MLLDIAEIDAHMLVLALSALCSKTLGLLDVLDILAVFLLPCCMMVDFGCELLLGLFKTRASTDASNTRTSDKSTRATTLSLLGYCTFSGKL